MQGFNDFKKYATDKFNIGSTYIDDVRNTMNGSIIPVIPEERNLNVSNMDVFSRLLVDRIIYLGEEVDDEVQNIIIAQLLYLNQVDHNKPIDMYINSPGGSVVSGLAIYDTMNLIDAPVFTTCVGMGASMGAFLLSSGEFGHRSALKHSRIMLHQVSAGTRGKLSDMEIRLRFTQSLSEDVFNILSENTGKPADELKAICKDDNWMTAKEAVGFGLIDNIIGKK